MPEKESLKKKRKRERKRENASNNLYVNTFQKELLNLNVRIIDIKYLVCSNIERCKK